MGTSVNNLKHVNVNFSLDKLYEDIRHYLVISHPHLVYFHVFNTVNGMKMLNQITKCLNFIILQAMSICNAYTGQFFYRQCEGMKF